MPLQHARASLTASRQRMYLMTASPAMQARRFRLLHGRQSAWSIRHVPAFIRSKHSRHIRLASHYNGRHRSCGRWQKGAEAEHDHAQEWNESDGYELSARERSWKQQMERMRQRVNADPYEAVFGRRFEPFWGPLIPAWMRAEVWPAENKSCSATKPADQKRAVHKGVDKEDTSPTPPTSYAYASSTSWDSTTNKTKRSEWDSISNETKHYEYDPISNRMVQASAKQHLSGSSPTASANEGPNAQVPSDAASRNTSAIEESVKAAQKLTSNAMPSDKSTIHIDQEKTGLDALTAHDIRASMGRTRSADGVQDHSILKRDLENLKTQKETLLRSDRRAFRLTDLSRRIGVLQTKITAAEAKLNDLNAERLASDAVQAESNSGSLQPAVDRMQSKPIRRVLEQDVSAAHEASKVAAANVPKSWGQQADMLQTDRIERITGSVSKTNDKTPLELRANKLSKANDILQREVNQQKHVMETHEERYKAGPATHQEKEKTSTNAPSTLGLPSSHSNEAQLVEAKYKAKIASLKQELDLAYKQSSRDADEFRDQIRQSEARNARLAENEEKYKLKLADVKQDLDTSFKQSSQHADEFRSQISKSSFDSEAATLRLVRANEKKYKAQISALKEELGLAYEQSSRHGEEFRRQIKALEAKLAKTTSAVDTVRDAVIPIARHSVSTAPHQAQQKQHDRDLVREIRAIYENAYGVIGYEQKATQIDTPTLEQCLDQYEHKQGYVFKADDLEQELSGKTTPAGVTSGQTAYQFRDDGLERELAGIPVSSSGTSINTGESKNAYTYKSDGLEQQLANKPDTNEVKEVDFAYDFKHDDLETELKNTRDEDLIKDDKTGVYHFRDDGLEAELRRSEGQALVDNERSNDAYQFREDSLETELKAPEGEAAVNDEHNKSYHFQHDNLEAELTNKSSPHTSTAEPAGLDNKSYAFEKDNLEAELAAQTPDATVTRQNRATLRQRIAEDFKDVARMLTEVRSGQISSNRRNPIDGMASSPAVGNYASPTGFVNHDPVVPFEQSSSPKIRREEPVFSGTQRVRSGRSSWHDRRHHDGHSMRRRRRRNKRVLKAAAVVIVAAMAVTYYQGANLEAQQAAIRQQVQRETWQQIAREYERSGERGVVKALDKMQNTGNTNVNGLFWK